MVKDLNFIDKILLRDSFESRYTTDFKEEILINNLDRQSTEHTIKSLWDPLSII